MNIKDLPLQIANPAFVASKNVEKNRDSLKGILYNYQLPETINLRQLSSTDGLGKFLLEIYKDPGIDEWELTYRHGHSKFTIDRVDSLYYATAALLIEKKRTGKLTIFRTPCSGFFLTELGKALLIQNGLLS